MPTSNRGKGALGKKKAKMKELTLDSRNKYQPETAPCKREDRIRKRRKEGENTEENFSSKAGLEASGNLAHRKKENKSEEGRNSSNYDLWAEARESEVIFGMSKTGNHTCQGEKGLKKKRGRTPSDKIRAVSPPTPTVIE